MSSLIRHLVRDDTRANLSDMAYRAAAGFYETNPPLADAIAFKRGQQPALLARQVMDNVIHSVADMPKDSPMVRVKLDRGLYAALTQEPMASQAGQLLLRIRRGGSGEKLLSHAEKQFLNEGIAAGLNVAQPVLEASAAASSRKRFAGWGL